ncbi:hypothetical protein [Floricoccus penangensis]|uniref:Uncharacterized protein n=1 Tax=Floricoccus penangensis TaxID=1859475 RepID=A0A9Q5JHM3_9LACT|nr:hypothetical protein [Floricoccus penangensis]OFI47702.1 hypothetical protein BG262_08350 [Floricoccus penangensis]URZ88287.1 hypothetical protein KIW23_04435 [Floricoccus penangensis]
MKTLEELQRLLESNYINREYGFNPEIELDGFEANIDEIEELASDFGYKIKIKDNIIYFL